MHIMSHELHVEGKEEECTHCREGWIVYRGVLKLCDWCKGTGKK